MILPSRIFSSVLRVPRFYILKKGSAIDLLFSRCLPSLFGETLYHLIPFLSVQTRRVQSPPRSPVPCEYLESFLPFLTQCAPLKSHKVPPNSLRVLSQSVLWYLCFAVRKRLETTSLLEGCGQCVSFLFFNNSFHPKFSPFIIFLPLSCMVPRGRPI